MGSRFKLTGLTGREHKMLMDPGHFPADPKAVAGQVWSRLPAILGPHLDDADGMPELPAGRKRKVRLHDTDRLALDRQGYSLRLRREDGKSEVTLKLRTGDILLSGGTSLPKPDDLDSGQGETSESKFEEDIAPLEVQAGEREVVLSAVAGTRSRFSRSVGRKKNGTYELARYDDAKGLFPTLHDSLAEAGVELAPSTILNAGPEIDERLFKPKGIALQDDLQVVLALTLWYFHDGEADAGAKPLRVIELSFQWQLPEAEQDDDEGRDRMRRRARRAGNLFVAMQKAFWEQIDRQTSSKTKLGLPSER